MKHRDFASAIYRGRVRHRRHAPHPHAFAYDIAYLQCMYANGHRVPVSGRFMPEQRTVAPSSAPYPPPPPGYVYPAPQ